MEETTKDRGVNKQNYSNPDGASVAIVISTHNATAKTKMYLALHLTYLQSALSGCPETHVGLTNSEQQGASKGCLQEACSSAVRVSLKVCKGKVRACKTALDTNDAQHQRHQSLSAPNIFVCRRIRILRTQIERQTSEGTSTGSYMCGCMIRSTSSTRKCLCPASESYAPSSRPASHGARRSRSSVDNL